MSLYLHTENIQTTSCFVGAVLAIFVTITKCIKGSAEVHATVWVVLRTGCTSDKHKYIHRAHKKAKQQRRWLFNSLIYRRIKQQLTFKQLTYSPDCYSYFITSGAVLQKITARFIWKRCSNSKWKTLTIVTFTSKSQTKHRRLHTLHNIIIVNW